MQLKFDVTAAGSVENVSVVESSDALFEESAIRALARWRYLPRIVAGKRVRHEGIHTIIRFQLAATSPPPDPRRGRERRRSDARVRSRSRPGSRSRSTGSRPTIYAAPSSSSTRCRPSIGAGSHADLWSFYGYCSDGKSEELVPKITVSCRLSIGGIRENQVVATRLRIKLNELQRVHHLNRAVKPGPTKILTHACCTPWIYVHENGGRRAKAEGLNAKGARTGEKVEHAAPATTSPRLEKIASGPDPWSDGWLGRAR